MQLRHYAASNWQQLGLSKGDNFVAAGCFAVDSHSYPDTRPALLGSQQHMHEQMRGQR